MLKPAGLFETEPSLLDGRLAILDLETTGTNPAHDRIIEIGLVQMNAGGIENQWSTLVNPQAGLSEFIQDYTGISTRMVTDAPPFAEIVPQLLPRLEGRILVAHNARFDHGFLQQELARCGLPFQPPTLCTLRLSRKLDPGERKHGLDALISRHALSCDNRHRALADARVLVGLFQSLHNRHSTATINQAVRAQLKR